MIKKKIRDKIENELNKSRGFIETNIEYRYVHAWLSIDDHNSHSGVVVLKTERDHLDDGSGKEATFIYRYFIVHDDDSIEETTLPFNPIKDKIEIYNLIMLNGIQCKNLILGDLILNNTNNLILEGEMKTVHFDRLMLHPPHLSSLEVRGSLNRMLVSLAHIDRLKIPSTTIRVQASNRTNIADLDKLTLNGVSIEMIER